MKNIKEYIESIELTEFEKKQFFLKFNYGDYWGLLYLEDILNERATVFNSEDIHDLINSVISLNGMVAMGETWSGPHSYYYDRIHSLYNDMLNDLLKVCGITDEDFKKFGSL